VAILLHFPVTGLFGKLFNIITTKSVCGISISVVGNWTVMQQQQQLQQHSRVIECIVAGADEEDATDSDVHCATVQLGWTQIRLAGRVL